MTVDFTNQTNNLENKEQPQFSATTTVVHGPLNNRRPQAHHALVTPIFQTATYTFQDTADLCQYMDAKMWGQAQGREEYGRYGNPTVRAVEKKLAALEAGPKTKSHRRIIRPLARFQLKWPPAGHIIHWWERPSGSKLDRRTDCIPYSKAE